MSSFNTDAFIIAGTAIAIGGVGLYLWDTRGPSSKTNATQKIDNDDFGIPGMSNDQQNPENSSFSRGGRKKQKTKNRNKNRNKKSIKK